MRTKDWETRLEKITEGQPFISENQLRRLGYGPASIKKLVYGLDKYGGGKAGHGRYAIPDVAERIMKNRI